MLKTSTIYQVLYSYLTTGEKVENLDNMLDEWKITDPTKETGSVASLITLCAALRAEMRAENSKKNGKPNVEKAAKTILKNVPGYLPHLQGAIDCNGRQAVCDNFTLLMLNSPIALPTSPVPCTTDFAGILDEARQNANIPLSLPDISDLAAYVKIKAAENKALYGKKAKGKCIEWDFGQDLPVVNAEYLLNILTAFPDAKAYAAEATGPLYFSSAQGEAILAPIKR